MSSEAIIEPDATAVQAPHEPASDLPEIVVSPSSGWASPDLRELWRYRELLYFLIWRDVKVRYKQTALGAAWAILQPTLTMLVFTLFFGKLAGMEKRTGGTPYPIFALAGLLPWTFFANAITNSGNSLVGSTNLITKVYFPRLVIPLAAVGAGVVDLCVSLAIMLVMMAVYRVGLTWQFALLPIFLLGTILAAIGVGTLLSALTVAYRDFRYVVPFMVQIWMFITPVIYPSSMVPDKWRWLLALNPMTGLIDGCRMAFLGTPISLATICTSFASTLALTIAGLWWFTKVEVYMADIA